MVRHTLRSLWSHKRRFISTCVAVILGVAFMAGTFVLTSTINHVFDDLFATGYDGIDAVVRGPELFKDAQQGGTQRDTIPETALAEVQAVDGVRSASGAIATQAITVLNAKGDPMGGNGPPTIVGTWTDDADLNPWSVIEGKAPTATGEAAMDKASFEAGGFRLGGPVRLITATGTEKLTIVGIMKFGDADSSGGTIDLRTTLGQAQALINEPGRLQEIYVRADEGVTPERVVANLKAAKVAPKVDIVTGKQAADEQSKELKDGFVSFFSTILLVFALIALFVGGFIISNTFGILVAQRTKELALLRAIGATRRQVLTSVLLEAGIVGVFSAVVGFVVGVGLAALALFLLSLAGLDLPSSAISVEPSSAVITILVGLFITTVAAILPAIRATRVPPIAALRDIAVDTSGRSRIRPIVGVLALVLGVVNILPAFGSDPTTDQLPGVGLGLGLIVVAVLVLGPTFAKPLSWLIGGPLPRLRGITGQIAQQNAMRSPRRTASTASALIIGVTLIVFITAFAASAQSSISDSISGGFRGQYIVQPRSQNGGVSGVSTDLAASLRKVHGVDLVAAASFTGAQMTLPDDSKPGGFVGGIDPSVYGQVFKVKMETGKLTDLVAGTMVVDRQIAEKHHIGLGDEVSVTSATGRTGTYEVSAISDEPNLLGQFTLTTSDAAKLSPTATDTFMGIKLDAGVGVKEIRPALEKVTDKYPTMKLQDSDEFVGSIVDQINALLNVIYGLLAVSVIIAILGIANTLSLSIHERTRELGLLRAVGMTRNQLRSSVRWEAAIIALMGTVIGTLLGIGASYTMVRALKANNFTTFDLPILGGLSLVTIAIVALALGVAAAFFPSRRAARLNVLDAIASD